MNKALFGRYWPAKSPVHDLDARVKITFVFLMIVAIFLADTWLSLGFCALIVFGLFALSRIPFVEALRSIVPLLFIIVLSALFNVFYVDGGNTLLDLGWVRITTGGLESAAFLSIRLALFLLLGSLLTMTTTTFDITFAIESMFSPLTRLKVPVHEFAFVVSTALHFLPQMVDEFDSIRMAQEARGAKLATTPLRGMRALSSLITPMFASVFRHADTLALAMDARCYVPGAKRTRIHPSHLGARDIAALAIAVLICIAIGLMRLL